MPCLYRILRSIPYSAKSYVLRETFLLPWIIPEKVESKMATILLERLLRDIEMIIMMTNCSRKEK
ncbi:hypothetical protein CF081_14925 [Clostridium botulinum]|nr:hypothetical protein RSJ14_18215 [Clostridium botulinum]AXG96923.1 hypothetical protein AGE31_15315 [Clostridium botulinum]MBN3366983.1 hypothetical protein [Clostridium botulinum]MBN3371152.1 hypothetical protein [Clostridium botulinum]MBN3373043.1 hypothetical protein [Clostridium botulinum]